MIARYDFHIQRGNHNPLQITLKPGGTPLNLTGATIVFRAQLGAAVIRKVSPTDIPTTDFALGKFTITLTPADTRLLPTNVGMDYEIEVRQSGTEVTWLQGKLIGQGGVNDDV